MIDITWFPMSDRSAASSRLRVWKIADALKGNPIVGDMHLSGHIQTGSECDVIVVQKRLDLHEQMIRWIGEGRRVIWDCDDYIPYPNLPDGVIVTVDTEYKRKLYPNAVIIPDCLDIDEPANLYPEGTARYLEEVVTASNPENMYHIQNAAAACYQLGISLTVITDTKHHAYAHFDGVQGVAWNVATVDAEIIKHDLFIAPLMFGHPQWSDDWVRSKSANRILKAWGLRMPVAATAIPSFLEAGLVYEAQTVDEWVAVLTNLESEEARYYDAGIGLQKANRYRADIIAKQWIDVFEGKL